MALVIVRFSQKSLGTNRCAKNSKGPEGALVAQWVKRWPTDLADRVRSSLEVKSSRP